MDSMKIGRAEKKRISMAFSYYTLSPSYFPRDLSGLKDIFSIRRRPIAIYNG